MKVAYFKYEQPRGPNQLTPNYVLFRYDRVSQGVVYPYHEGGNASRVFQLPTKSGVFVHIDEDDTFIDTLGYRREKAGKAGKSGLGIPRNYAEVKEKHLKKLQAFPHFRAMTEGELRKEMDKLGLKELDDIVSVGNNCFIKKDDVLTYMGILMQFKEELIDRIQADFPYHDFAYEMFYTELMARDFAHNPDYQPTVEALGFGREEVYDNGSLYEGLTEACHQITGTTKSFETLKVEANKK